MARRIRRAASTTPGRTGRSCRATRRWTGWVMRGSSRSSRSATYSMNGVSAKGSARCTSEKVGRVTSPSWVWQLGHHESTSPVPAPPSRSMVLKPTRPAPSPSPARYWKIPQQADGPPITS